MARISAFQAEGPGSTPGRRIQINHKMEEKKEKLRTKITHFHNKYYKHLLIIPAIILLFSFVYLGIFYNNNGDFMHKDISLVGGTTVTIYEKINVEIKFVKDSKKIADLTLLLSNSEGCR